MKKALIAAVAASAMVAGAAHAQGLVGGAQQGMQQGDAAAGPIGGVVGGAVGAATGTVGGIFGGNPLGMGTGMMSPGMGMMGPGMGMGMGLREYIAAENIPSYPYRGPVTVGTRLPRGVTYYVVPQTYGAIPYRYTVVNNEAVLVDPRTHRIVQVL